MHYKQGKDLIKTSTAAEFGRDIAADGYCPQKSRIPFEADRQLSDNSARVAGGGVFIPKC